MEEQKNLDDVGFSINLAKYFIARVLPYLKSPVLDLGCGIGVVSKLLVQKGFKVVGVDGSESKVKVARNNVPRAKFVVSIFENFEPQGPFKTVIAKNVLEHLHPEQSRQLAKKMYSWLNPKGKAIVYVPNALSLNRRLGYFMGISKHYSELTELDVAVGHVQAYTRQTLELEFNEAGFKILEIKGLFLKPFPNEIMAVLNEKICDALFQVANDPLCADLCSGIYLVGERG